MAGWRPWVRAIHRDTGYVAVGLTLVYALSGLAVNHVSTWDPSFVSRQRSVDLPVPIAGDTDAEIARTILEALQVEGPPNDIFRNQDELQLTLDRHTVVVNMRTGHVDDEEQVPRVFFSAVNWLHLNRSKQAWTWFADAYALALIYLALSGLFMIPGRKGLRGRGAVLALVGGAIPLLYLAVAS